MVSGEQQATVAANYYDSEDAFNFYQHTWGGESIHCGLYDIVPEKGPGVDDKFKRVQEASLLTTERLFDIVEGLTLTADSKVCDLGAGLGGTARLCAKKYGCIILCVEVSKKENDWSRARAKEAGVADKVLIPKELSYFDTEAAAASMDLIVSQEALLHAGNERAKVFVEAARILKPGGYMVFCDFMMKEGASISSLDKVLKRIKLESLASPQELQRVGEAAGLTHIKYEDRSACGAAHFTTVAEVLEGKKATIKDISPEFIDNMLDGLKAWKAAYEEGTMAWGFTVFQKPR